MLDLIYQMIWRMCMIVTIAFLVTRLNLFRQMIHQGLSWKGKLGMIFVFGLFGIIGNYTGVFIQLDISKIPFGYSDQNLESFKAIAGTRNIGVILGGLLGGPAVGLGAGLILIKCSMYSYVIKPVDIVLANSQSGNNKSAFI